MKKKCANCARAYQMRITGGDYWNDYCHQGDMYRPCSGGDCDYPELFEKREKEKEKKSI